VLRCLYIEDMEIFARINILDGKAVRLPHGDVNEAIPLDEDPPNRAKGWVNKGAGRLFVVDLDAAAYGTDINREVIAEMIKAVDVPVQVGGGVRSRAEVERILGMGAWRVSIGTLAIIDQVAFWELNRLHPHRIVVSLDVKADNEIVIRGQTEETGEYLEETMIALSSGGAAAFMITEVGRDALEEPPNFEALAMAIDLVDEPVIAAGGVRDLADVAKLAKLGNGGRSLAGIVVGREVTAGRFTMEELFEAISGEGSAFGPWTRADLDAAAARYAEDSGDSDVLKPLTGFIRWLAAEK
jgi:phosphoribosylformimino-5-aminoimidazole carboxamide ribotide isomerase